MLVIILLLALLVFTLLCCLVALFEEKCTELIKAFFVILASPIQIAEDNLREFYSGVKRFYRCQFEDDEKVLRPKTILYHFIGANLYTLSLILFITADFYLLCLTLAGMGFEIAKIEPPLDAGLLTAVALSTISFFFGMVLLDLVGMTNIAPWLEKLSKKAKKVLTVIVICSIIIMILTTILFGVWRGSSLTETPTLQDYPIDTNISSTQDYNQYLQLGPENIPDLSEDQSLYWIVYFSNLVIPLLLVIGSFLGGWGVIIFIKFILLGSMFIVISPLLLLYIVSCYAVLLVNRLFDFFNTLLELMAAIGNSILNFFKQRTKIAEDRCEKQDNTADPEYIVFNEDQTENEKNWNPYKSN